MSLLPSRIQVQTEPYQQLVVLHSVRFIKSQCPGDTTTKHLIDGYNLVNKKTTVNSDFDSYIGNAMRDPHIIVAETRIGSPDSVGGAACLEFANTVENYRLDSSPDLFSRYEDLLPWSQQQGLVQESTSTRLSRTAETDASQAADVFAAAKALRARIYRVFSAIAHGREPATADIFTLNRELSWALAHLQLEGSEGRYNWFWRDQATCLDSVLWPVLRSAAELLAAPDLERLRQCNGHDCTWLFLDRSKNRSRRWCEMQVCGNRAKSRRHYARSRAPA